MTLEMKFEIELEKKSQIAIKECHYVPTYFMQMMNEIGGVATAKRLIEKGRQTGNPSEGFIKLYLMGRLELTMEESVCKEEFQPLFTEDEINYCKELLGKK